MTNRREDGIVVCQVPAASRLTVTFFDFCAFLIIPACMFQGNVV